MRPWWQYDEERNLVESIGPTCDIATFILKYMDPGSELYRKTEKITNQLLTGFQDCENFGDMGIAGFMGMVETLKELKYGDYDYDAFWEKIKILVQKFHRNRCLQMGLLRCPPLQLHHRAAERLL